MMQQPINQGYVAILSVHAANNKDQKVHETETGKAGMCKRQVCTQDGPPSQNTEFLE